MKVVNRIDEIRELVLNERVKVKSIGFVPTMGALHNGHRFLIDQAVKENDFTVVSIFVNPLQFGPNEDYDRYPKSFEEDIALCKDSGVNVIFAPSRDDIFGDKNLTFVDIEELQNNLCGSKRVGHFRGVCTIVTKLFNIVMPDRSYFGKKDIQQLCIVKRMVKDLNIPTLIIGCDIVRDKDGLALSSRNRYLSSSEREDALVLSRSIKSALDMIKNGETSSKNVIKHITTLIQKTKSAKIDYINIVDEEMKDVSVIKDGNILALALFIGTTRLIDNHIIGEKLCF